MVNKDKEIIYVCGPYAHRYQTVRGNREHQLTAAAAMIARYGHIVYSPITHSAPLKRMGLNLSHDQWMAFDLPFMRLATQAVVLKINGWWESRGVVKKMSVFQELGTRVSILLPDHVEEWAERLAEEIKKA